jgi:hypothetical protein
LGSIHTVLPSFVALLALGVVVMLVALAYAARVVDPRLDPSGERLEPDDVGNSRLR